MSLITRCPACGTMFKVVSDQLKVSQGWVRCGQCASVFDASLHLQNDVPQQPDQGALPVRPVVNSAEVPALSATATNSSGMGPSSLETAGSQSEAAFAPVENALQESISPPNAAPDLVPTDVSFVRDARRQAFWRRPSIRIVLILIALILTGLLVLQTAVQQRDRLAVLEPRLIPVLKIICESLGCTVGPVRQIEAIVIDSSSFNKINESAYRLSFSIKSTASTVVEMPSLEITLTDTQDQAVIRRVLLPAQFGMASGLLGASGEFSGALVLQLTPTELLRDDGQLSQRVAGYRLLAFYP